MWILLKFLCKTLYNSFKNFGFLRGLLLIFAGVVAMYVADLVPILQGPLMYKCFAMIPFPIISFLCVSVCSVTLVTGAVY